MIILGLTGNLNKIFEQTNEVPYDTDCDAAAVLIINGKVVTAIEEERLNRIKHSPKAPLLAIKACLNMNNIRMSDVDRIAIFGNEDIQDNKYRTQFLYNNYQGDRRVTNIRSALCDLLEEEFQEKVDPRKFIFVSHHIAHAYSAFIASGFQKSLVLSIDGAGDGISGLILNGENGKMEIIRTIESSDSLGFFYMKVVRFLGYSIGDEYKIMGLAPYGDPSVYRKIFRKLYKLGENGTFTLSHDKLDVLFYMLSPRLKGEPIEQSHKDLAAAVQETLEIIVMHILDYYKELTGHNNLSMAGGVAHNCSMTGKILYSNLFDDIYIQPASHDAGNALGAAYYVLLNEEPEVSYSRLNDVYLGEDIGDDKQIEQELQLWKEFIDISKPENIVEECSQLLADGNVIGWVQGRSEFGPRALGNRSILADPRPSENKNIINRMIKTREDYRPFAPAILEESAREYFEIPEQYGANMFSFMNMVLKVRREKQKSLGAVTHVDGSARVQTVSSTTNRLFYNLIASFEKKTGVPVLLNTSFNNNYEPIVDSINDSVVCFLTTQLNYLCIGNFLIRKRPLKSEAVMKLIPVLPQYVSLNKRKKTSNDGVQMDYVYEISFCYFFGQTVSISKKVYDFLIEVDHSKSVGEIIQNQSLFNIDERIKIEDIVDLWTRRLLKLTVKK